MEARDKLLLEPLLKELLRESDDPALKLIIRGKPLPVATVARFLEVSEDFVRRAIEEGRLKAVKLSERKLRVRVGALLDYVESLPEATTAT